MFDFMNCFRSACSEEQTVSPLCESNAEKSACTAEATIPTADEAAVLVTETIPVEEDRPAADEEASDAVSSFDLAESLQADDSTACSSDSPVDVPEQTTESFASPVLVVAKSEPWQAPTVGGNDAPTVATLKNMLSSAEPLLISLNSRSSLERKPTRDQSVAYTLQYIANCYESALNNHDVVSYMGRLVFPLPGIWVETSGVKSRLAGTLIPTFYTYGWRFAYTEDTAFTSRFDDSCYEAPLAEETTVQESATEQMSAAVLSSHLTPVEYLTECGYHILSATDGTEQLPSLLRDLVHRLADAVTDPLVAEFLQTVRNCIPQNKVGYLDMSNASPASIELLCDLLDRMQKLGFFTQLSVNKLTNLVRYNVSRNKRCRDFLCGKWLEYYTAELCTRVVNEIAAEHGLSAQFASNIVLSECDDPTIPRHELDCAFTVGGLFFWIEAKSSSRNIDYDKYRLRGLELKVIPDRFLMLNADLNQDELEAVEWLYAYHVANCVSFVGTLRAMVTSALETVHTPDAHAA